MPRWVEVVLALMALVLLSPLFLLISFAILLSSRGSVVYIQRRLGKEGRVFHLYKFRTMEVDAEKKISWLLQTCPHSQREWALYQKLKCDPRIFPLGKFLRRFSLDELPQFYNVLKGDLSLVGPRPYTLDQKPLLGESQQWILSVKPGITGLWQTSGRNQTTFQKRLELDVLYSQRRSFFLDVKLLCKTLPVVLFAHDGY